MIRTIITPDKQRVSINVPKSYVGKKIEVLLYAVEELIEELPSKINKAARFKGLLSTEQAERYHQYLKKARNEWDRDI